MTFEIRIDNSVRFGYTVYLNGETVLECLSEDEVARLTIEEIVKIANGDY